MNKTIVITATMLIALSIIFGAFGAHGLKTVVSEECLDVFVKGVKYQMYSGLGFMIMGISSSKLQFSLKWFFRLGLAGITIFSTMLYLLTFKDLIPELQIAGAIVPIGGTLMILSWVVLSLQLIRSK